MKKLDLVEAAVIGLIVAILVWTGWSIVAGGSRFKDACREAGGKAVWDGRQYQCLGARQ